MLHSLDFTDDAGPFADRFAALHMIDDDATPQEADGACNGGQTVSRDFGDRHQSSRWEQLCFHSTTRQMKENGARNVTERHTCGVGIMTAPAAVARRAVALSSQNRALAVATAG